MKIYVFQPTAFEYNDSGYDQSGYEEARVFKTKREAQEALIKNLLGNNILEYSEGYYLRESTFTIIKSLYEKYGIKGIEFTDREDWDFIANFSLSDKLPFEEAIGIVRLIESDLYVSFGNIIETEI